MGVRSNGTWVFFFFRVRLTRGASLLILLACTVISLGKSGESRRPLAHKPGKHEPIEGVPNFGEVTPKLYRGGQPTRAGFEKLAKMGIKIVVDTGRSARDEKLLKGLGLRYVALPWYCPFPKDKVIAEFLEILKDNPEAKTFVHCRLGEDRSGMMVAAYRMAEQGWTPDEAMNEMHEFGFGAVHHLICPGLARYEHHFPEHWKKGEAFKELRESKKTSK
jgi:tyrosine-protein phosphatase SIW14